MDASRKPLAKVEGRRLMPLSGLTIAWRGTPSLDEEIYPRRSRVGAEGEKPSVAAENDVEEGSRAARKGLRAQELELWPDRPGFACPLALPREREDTSGL
jgi:hypothetical protein